MKSVIRIIFFATIIWLVSAIGAWAQLPQDFRTEQIALCLQRTECLPGDTVMVTGQVTCIAANRFEPYSKYLYLELIDSNDSVVCRQKVACRSQGAFSTLLPVDPLAHSGVYYVRAYTRMMRSFSPLSFAVEPLLVGVTYPETNRSTTTSADVRCTIVPHGGHLHAGSLQSVTVRVANRLNDPLGAVPMVLTSEKGDTVAKHLSTPSGLALISFVPKPDTAYFLDIFVGKNRRRFPIDLCEDSQPLIQLSLRDKKVSFVVEDISPDKNTYHLYAYDRMNGLMHSRLNRSVGSFMLENTPQVLTLFLTDDKCRILAQRTTVNRSDDALQLLIPPVITVNTPIVMPKMEGATVLARLVPQRSRCAQAAESQLLYLPDFSSPIPFPEQYYTLSQHDRSVELQAWIGTASFRRFDLERAVRLDSAIYTYMPEQVMHFDGKVTSANQKNMHGGHIVAYNTATNAVYNADVDDNGNFRIGVDDFQCGTRFFLQAIDEQNKPQSATITIADDTFPAVEIPIRLVWDNNRLTPSGTDSAPSGNRQLTEITVKARLNTDDVVSSNRYYGNYYKSAEAINRRHYLTLRDILRDVEGVQVTVPNGANDFVIMPTHAHSTSQQATAVPLVIDGKRYTSPLSCLLEMPAFDIQSVEYLRPWQTSAYTSGATEGAVVVTTQGYSQLPKAKSKGTMYTPLGLAPNAEPPVLKAESPGNYRLIVDVISPSGIHSFESRIKVVEK